MKNRKVSMTLLAAALAAVLTLQTAGCVITLPADSIGGNNGGTSAGNNGGTAAENKGGSAAENDAGTESSTKRADSGGISWSFEEPEETYDPWKVFQLKPGIEETVLYDGNQVRITAKELKYKSDTAYLTVRIENERDEDIEVLSNITSYGINSINGYMYSFGYMDLSVPTGGYVEKNVTIYGKDLAMFGISEIADLEMGFNIKYGKDEEILTGPCPVRTSVADSYDYSQVSFKNGVTNPWYQKEYGYTVVSCGEAKIYDVLGVSIRSEVILENKQGQLSISLEAENSSDSIRRVTLGDICLNGVMVSHGNWTSEEITPGKTGLLQFMISSLADDTVLKIAGLDDPAAVSFSLTQKDEDYDVLADPSSVTLSFGGEGQVNKAKEVYRSDRIVVWQAGIVPDDSKYSDDLHIVLFYENLTEEELDIRYPYNGFFINGSADGTAGAYSMTLEPGICRLEDIKIYSYSFDDVGIDDWAEVTDLRLQIQVKDSYWKTLEETTLTLDPEVTK